MIEAGTRWQHPGGGVYLVTTLCEIKDDETGDWKAGVVYRPVESGFEAVARHRAVKPSCYVRTEENFLQRMKPL